MHYVVYAKGGFNKATNSALVDITGFNNLLVLFYFNWFNKKLNLKMSFQESWRHHFFAMSLVKTTQTIEASKD